MSFYIALFFFFLSYFNFGDGIVVVVVIAGK